MSANDLPINASYASWSPDSRFRLVSVPWDSGYRNVVEFTSSQAQHDYFANLPGLQVTKASMQRYGMPVRVDVPFNQASLYNYLVVEQPYTFDTTKTYYYFVTDCTQVNANVTQLNVYLDVWQTYLFDRTWGQAYVERGHIGVANENQMAYHMRANLDIPEGLDCGSEYRIVKQADQHYLARKRHDGETHPDETGRALVIVSTVDLTKDPGSVENPRLNTADGNVVSSIPSGANTFCIWGDDSINRFWAVMRTYPWVSQGIIGMWMVPATLVHGRDGFSVKMFGRDDTPQLYYPTELARKRLFQRVDHLISMDNLALPQRYAHLKKFLTYPYCFVECVTTNGSQITMKPQYLDSDDVVLDSVEWVGAPSPRMWIMPRGYNGDERYSMTFGFDDFPRLIGVSSGSAMWLASNANSLRYQRSSAEWSQSKTQMGINNAFAQANERADFAQRSTTRSNLLSRNMAALSVNTANAQTSTANQYAQMGVTLANEFSRYGAVMDGVGAIASSSSPASALIGAGSVAIGQSMRESQANAQLTLDNAQRNASTDISNSATTQSMEYANQNRTSQTDDATSMARRFADQNRVLSTAVAQGDYENAIAGINARVQDAQLTPPSTVGTLGGEAALIALDDNMCQVRLRRINDAAIRNIGEVWLRYGYYVQRYMTLPARLKCMSHFAYWKCQDVELVRGAMPEEFKLTLKGILEKGVTVWSDPNIIATCDKGDNAPLPGYRY